MKKGHESNGVILIEAVVGLAFAGFVVLALTTMFTTGHDAYLHSRNYTQALYLAEAKVEETSVLPFSTITSQNSQTEKINGVSYTWTRRIQPVKTGGALQQIEVNVQWVEPSGKRQAKLITQEIFQP